MRLRNVERLVRESVSTAWSNYLAAQSQSESSAEQVRANELAFEGVEAEAAVGLRTTLDVLNAEQELLNARLALVQSQRDAYVAGFRVLQAIGAGDPRRPKKALLALGYAGWGPGQLEREIQSNAWLHCPADPTLMFDTPPDDRWRQSFARLGVTEANFSAEWAKPRDLGAPAH